MKKLTITLGLLLALGLTSCYDFSREQDEKDAVTVPSETDEVVEDEDLAF